MLLAGHLRPRLRGMRIIVPWFSDQVRAQQFFVGHDLVELSVAFCKSLLQFSDALSDCRFNFLSGLLKFYAGHVIEDWHTIDFRWRTYSRLHIRRKGVIWIGIAER